MIIHEVPNLSMGRVGSTFMSLNSSAQISCLILSGQIASPIGVRHVFALCAVLLGALIVAGSLWMEPNTRAATA